jgi:hypothetical protein
MIRPPAWWPTADGEPIGEERARELIAYIKQRAPAIIALAREHLEEGHPGQPIKTYAVPAAQLGECRLEPHMTGIGIGVVYTGQGGTSDQVSIALTRNGWITATLSKSTDPVQHWVGG